MTTDLGSRDTSVSGAPARVANHALGAFAGEVVRDQYTLARSLSRPTPRLRRQTGARNDALCYLRCACVDRARWRLAQRFALQLAHRHGIRGSETSLVPWLAREHCRHNGAALVQWVLQELGTRDSESSATDGDARVLFATLSASLESLLADVAEPQP